MDSPLNQILGTPSVMEGSLRFGKDPRKFNRPTASGAMENLAGTPLPRRVATDWLPTSSPDARMKGAAQELAKRFIQKHGTFDKAISNMGELESLNQLRDEITKDMWGKYGLRGSAVPIKERLEGENASSWAKLDPGTKRRIKERVDAAAQEEFLKRELPGTASVQYWLAREGKVGREQRVSFPLGSPTKGPNETDAEFLKRAREFYKSTQGMPYSPAGIKDLAENYGLTDIDQGQPAKPRGIIPEDPSRSGARWFDPLAPIDPHTQEFLGGEERFSSKKGMPEKYLTKFEDFEFVKKDAFGNPLKGGEPTDIRSPFTPPATKGPLAQADALEGLSNTLWKKLESYTGLAPDEQDTYQKRVSLLSKKLKEAANLFRNDEDEGRVALKKIIPQVHQLSQELDVGAPPFKVTGGGGLVNRASGAKDPLDLLIQQETIERLQRDPTKLIEELPYENLGQVQMGLEQSQPQKLRQALGHLAAPFDYRMAAESQAAVPTPDLPLQSLLAEPRAPLDKGTFMGAMERVSRTEFSEAAPRIGLSRYGGVFEEGAEKLWNKALTRLAQRL